MLATRGVVRLAAVPRTMASQLVEAMVMKDILTIEEAKEKLGRGETSKVKEICKMARVDLEPMLLKEWLKTAP